MAKVGVIVMGKPGYFQKYGNSLPKQHKSQTVDQLYHSAEGPRREQKVRIHFLYSFDTYVYDQSMERS